MPLPSGFLAGGFFLCLLLDPRKELCHQASLPAFLAEFMQKQQRGCATSSWPDPQFVGSKWLLSINYTHADPLRLPWLQMGTLQISSLFLVTRNITAHKLHVVGGCIWNTRGTWCNPRVALVSESHHIGPVGWYFAHQRASVIWCRIGT